MTTRPYCNTFCQHPCCWKAFSNYLKTLGNFHDENLFESSLYKHTRGSQSLHDIDDEDADDEYNESRDLKPLWVCDILNSSDLSQVVDKQQINNGIKHLMHYIERKRRRRSGMNPKTADNAHDKYHIFNINEKMTQYEYTSLTKKVLKWLPKSRNVAQTTEK